MPKSAAEIRQEFLDFFCQKHGHTFVRGASVIPYDDPTLLFTNAGMNQFKPLFLGTADRNSEFGRLKRAANSQPCIRAGGKHNDLDDVGHDTYHHTLFEMLGNWSFGDYFKKEAIEWAWELVTDVWGVDPSRLHATYFGGDEKEGLEPDIEARDLWRGMPGMAADRVHPGNKKDNFWEMGDTGPCGPCSEIHIDLSPDKSCGHLVNAGDHRVMEFWNLVFIQFNRGPDGKLTPLPAKHVDTGMGFERIAGILQGHCNNYATDVFWPIIQAVEQLSKHKYGTGVPRPAGANRYAVFDAANMGDVACRVIADHIRTLVFAISDGCPPDKDGRGFVLRRILRRAVRYGWQYLNLRDPFLCKLVPTVVDVLGGAFPKLKEQPGRVAEILRGEEESFARTLDRGIALFDEAAGRAVKDHNGEIQGDDAFKLHDTYGFPIDLTQIMANERKLRVDIGEYERLMEEARRRARSAGTAGDVRAALAHPAWQSQLTGLGSRFVGYDNLTAPCIVTQALRFNGDPVACMELSAGERGALVLDPSPFYPEKGGQVGDCGVVTTGTGRFDVEDTQEINGLIIAFGRCSEGRILKYYEGQATYGELEDPTEQEAQSVDVANAVVDRLRRIPTQQNHTATHILNWSLREVLDPGGQQLQQKGSLVDPDKTRFDFSHNKAVEPAEIERIEALCDDQIRRNLKVETNDNVPVSQKDAMKINGLRAVFGEKYPDQVRVVSIGVPVQELLARPDNPEWRKYSIEFCGGTHVKRTGEIEAFAIISEEAVAKGIRRVVGVTGQKARDAIDHGTRLLDEVASLRRAAPAELAQALPQLQKALESATLRVVDRAKLRGAVAELQAKVKQDQKAAASQSAGEVLGQVAALLAAATKIGPTTLVVAEMPDVPIDALKTAADAIKQKSGSAAIFFGVRGEKATLLAAVTDDLIKQGVKAGDWVKAIAPIVDGGGGGPPTMAQAGGKSPARLAEALQAARTWLTGKLAATDRAPG